MTAAALFAGFLVLIALRVPITMAIGLAVLAALLASGFSDTLWVIPLKVMEGVDNPSLLAIPFFVMAGNLMNAVGMTKRIFTLANALVGHFKAGLAQVNVLASIMFAGGTGAAVADIAGLGTVEIKAMRERGYKPSFAAAITTVSAIVAPFIPPSVPLVVYAFLSNTSVARMFLAGIVPALVVAGALMLFNRFLARTHDFPIQKRASAREIWRHALDGVAALAAPGIIMVGILTGTTTAAEAGILACAYTLLLGLVYRTLDWRHVWNAVSETMLITSVIMIIIGFANGMGWLLAIEQIPQQLAAGLPELVDSPFAFLCLVVVMMLVIGCFIDGVTAKLLLVPILLPLVDSFGIDRVHFGIVMQMSLILGLATPPLGIGLYIVSKIAEIPVEEVVRAVLPFFLPLSLVLLLFAAVPEIALWLPDLVMGPQQ
ncbi:C4-dicarboxylate ABC transporter permease [Phormidium willei BDU 130791]|nr:C4-dicarboxylate ABC transporter permease [Phormidium willei BDU 130791]